MSPSSERLCTSCGRTVSGRSRFCVGCGADLSAAEAGAVATAPVPRSRRRREPAAVAAVEVEEATIVEAPPADGDGPEPTAVDPPVPPPSLAPPRYPVTPPAVADPEPVAEAEVVAVAVEPPVAAPAPAAADVPAGPDTNLIRALQRASRSSPIAAGVVAALLAALLVCAVTALIGALFWFAHTRNGCAADASFANGTCTETAGANGFMTNWNAVLWPFQGAGVVISASDGSSLTMRIPLGLGMLLTAAALYVAGRVSVRLLPPRLPRDILIRAAVIAVAYTALMAIIGALVTARGGGYAVGPDYGVLVIWTLVLAFCGSALGIARRLFGRTVPAAPLAMISARYPRLSALLGPACVAAAAALAASAVLGCIAMATHTDDVATIVHAAFVDLTTRQLPDSVWAAFASLILVVLALPTIAAWVLAYAMAMPSVGVGTPSGATDFGLGLGDHDAWFWAVLAVPILASLLAGYGAARRRRAGSVEAAMGFGALGGVLWAAIAFLYIVLFDGAGNIGTGFGLRNVLPSVPFGPGLQNTFLSLVLFGPVGGAIGGYISLLTYRSTVGLPILRRWNVDRVGSPIIPLDRRCPACGRSAATDARFCSGCGVSLAPTPAPAPVP